MKTIIHKAETRGQADHGWLQSRHSFSFANYYDPKRMNFGALRVLNDDIVAPGMGFGKHPHDNMEIISIPLEGDLEHSDSMGNTTVIKQGDIQVMSAGTGVFHSEYNKNKDQSVKFLQIWVIPNQKNVTPRYDQITLDAQHLNNTLYQIVSPSPEDQGVWIHQNAWFHLGTFEKGYTSSYTPKNLDNGVYAFVLEGEMTIATQKLHKRDGLGIIEAKSIDIHADSTAKLLIIEVPMLI
ncbi:pirin family protein [Aquimarina algicola]|uniref:Pirin family protein n=1 Tax=Aquimarina algicola TaxID=2589995 RepID=A0A504J816_9FLAO|nr:pirin family protein [Aquimarina algicola]TPN84735.1 pirin family protein [Aquimarina algicola]